MSPAAGVAAYVARSEGRDAAWEGMFPAAALATIGNLRATALFAAMQARLLAAEPLGGAGRAARSAALAEQVARHREDVRAVVEGPLTALALSDFAPVEAYAARLDALDPAGDHAGLTEREADALVAEAHGAVVPALGAVLGRIRAQELRDAERGNRRIADRDALIDAALRDMERIGRMIRLISLNASVEAARAGGATGKAFTVIAEEVRSLSAQSEALTRRSRAALAAQDAGPG